MKTSCLFPFSFLFFLRERIYEQLNGQEKLLQGQVIEFLRKSYIATLGSYKQIIQSNTKETASLEKKIASGR